jgi:hypothetical protein
MTVSFQFEGKMAMKPKYPQVGLFGSIAGEWREEHVIPLLKRLGVSYFHPGNSETGVWTQVMGLREADVLENAETIIMVINHSSPGFGGLAEAGWAALGAATRGQTFILYIPMNYKFEISGWEAMIPPAKKYADMLDDYAGRTRYLVHEHAKRFEKQINNLYVVESIEEMLKVLRQQYEKK